MLHSFSSIPILKFLGVVFVATEVVQLVIDPTVWWLYRFGP
jgi:hypothetical protein